jgi:hypothetical protein
LLGKTGFTQLNFGLGLEYQLESPAENFIHLFAEVGYGVVVSSIASNDSFKGTWANRASTITLGINLGIQK